MKTYLYLLVAALGLATSNAGAAAITPGQNVTGISAGNLQPAGPAAFNGQLVNEPGLAYSKTYLLDMAQYTASKVAAQNVYSTVTFTSPMVSDGSESTGSVRVISVTGLSSATATDQITVTTNAFASNPTITVQNCVLKMGRDFNRGSSAQNTAANLATAIHACVPAISASASGGIVYATATYGSYANSYAFVSDNSSMTVASALMTGGADNAVLTIGSKTLTQGTDWNAGASTTTAVLSLGNAIANAGLSLSTVASGGLGVIYATSTLNGTAYNYVLASSSPTVLSVSGMTGGTNPGLTLSGKTMTAGAATTFTLGLPVLWAIGANPAIGGLTTGTTYYAVPVSATQFQLALYSTSAVAGVPASDFVTFTSTNSGSTAHTYTIAPLPWNGSATFIWQASNDNSNWATASYTGNVSTGTVTITNATAATNTLLDFGVFNFRYLRFNYTAPTAGALKLSVPVYVKQDGIGPF